MTKCFFHGPKNWAIKDKNSFFKQFKAYKGLPITHYKTFETHGDYQRQSLVNRNWFYGRFIITDKKEISEQTLYTCRVDFDTREELYQQWRLGYADYKYPPNDKKLSAYFTFFSKQDLETNTPFAASILLGSFSTTKDANYVRATILVRQLESIPMTDYTEFDRPHRDP